MLDIPRKVRAAVRDNLLKHRDFTNNRSLVVTL